MYQDFAPLLSCSFSTQTLDILVVDELVNPGQVLHPWYFQLSFHWHYLQFRFLCFPIPVVESRTKKKK